MAASIQLWDAAIVVSKCDNNKRAFAAIIAAEESAGRGAGIKGALKSLQFVG
jgi:hypothetical protein